VKGLASQLRDYGRFVEEELTPVGVEGAEIVGGEPVSEPTRSRRLASIAITVAILTIFAIRFGLQSVPVDDVSASDSTNPSVPPTTLVGEVRVVAPEQVTTPEGPGWRLTTSIGDLIWTGAGGPSPEPMLETADGLFAVENGIGYQSVNGLDWVEAGSVLGSARDQYIPVDPPGDLYRIPEAGLCDHVCTNVVTVQRSTDGGISWIDSVLENTGGETIHTGTARIYHNGRGFLLEFKAGVGCGRNELWTSPDGEQWSYLNRPWGACRNVPEVLVLGGELPSTSPATREFFFYQLNSFPIEPGGPEVYDGISAWRSVDGVEWTEVAVEGLEAVISAEFSLEISFSEGTFLARLKAESTRSNHLYRSEDGVRFFDLGPSPDGFGQPFASGWARIQGGNLQVSADGVEWDEVLASEGRGYPGFSPGLPHLTPRIWSDLITVETDYGAAFVGHLEKAGR
jgi:hypothetical protein